MRAALICCLTLSLLSAPLDAQERYRPPADTLFIRSVNPYRMYFVRDGDTLSQPIRSLSVEAQRWEPDGNDLRVIVRQMTLDVHRQVKVDTFTITPRGAVTAINSRPPGLHARVDFLLRLPDRPIRAGLTWSDTLRSPGSGANRDYGVARTYRVDRVLDSSGTRIAHISASGVVHYRDRWWIDSTAGTSYSIDVTGPVTEQFMFAVGPGQLLRRIWSMALTGRGTLPADDGGLDTVPAGLLSADTQEVIAPQQARLLKRSLPGRDTSVTLSGGTILLHTVERLPDEVAAGMARNDGLVGTAHARYAGGVVQSYEALWTDTATEPRRIILSLTSDSLRVRDPGRGDTALTIPNAWWGVADYGMNEFLVPTLLQHAPNGVMDSFAIYRPYARHWDVGTANLRKVGEHFLASYRIGSDTAATYLLITSDGDLLLAENSGPNGAQRVPPEGTPRRARLEEILKALQSR